MKIRESIELKFCFPRTVIERKLIPDASLSHLVPPHFSERVIIRVVVTDQNTRGTKAIILRVALQAVTFDLFVDGLRFVLALLDAF